MTTVEIIEEGNPLVITVEVPGQPGAASNLTIGTVTTGDAGSDAEVEITGTAPNQILNLTIPRGEAGPAGASGDHSTLLNLDADDHPQYYNQTRGDARYSQLGHLHDDRYYTESETDTLLTGKSDVGHNHDTLYYTQSAADTLLAGKSDTTHNHDSRYYTETETDTLLTGKANSVHTHDDRYYTETETDTLLAGKSDTTHNHDSRYYTETETDTLLSGKANTSHTHTATNISDSTAVGRSVLTAADAAAARTAIGAGTSSLALGATSTTAAAGDHTHNYITSFADPNADRIVFWDDSAGAYAALSPTSPLQISGTSISINAASDTAAGIVELATDAEVQTGTDTARAITAANLSARTATETRTGVAEIATSAETSTGTDDSRIVTPLKLKGITDLKANTSTTISAGAGLTGGGDLSANRTLAVSYGSSAGTAVQGNDTRVTADQAAGTASIRTLGTGSTQAAAGNHTHAAKDISNASVALTDGATIATDASLGRLFRVTIAGNRTLSAPTNASDGMRILYEVTASAADRTLTLTTGSAGAFAYGTDFTSIPTITSGTTTFIGCVYSSRSNRWHVLAVGSGHA